MPYCFMQPPSNKPGIPFRNVYGITDTAGTDHRDKEVYWINRDHRMAQIEWIEAHQ